MNSSTFSRNGKNSLYHTTNEQYGSSWVQDHNNSLNSNIKTAIVPSYAEIVQSMNDFKKSQRLLKNKLIQQKLQAQGIDLKSDNNRFMKKTQFHVKNSQSLFYPTSGINVGPPIYRTNNMNYGSRKPAEFELQSKYYPSNNTFSKSFCGGNYKFDGLNTVKGISNVHNALNEI